MRKLFASILSLTVVLSIFLVFQPAVSQIPGWGTWQNWENVTVSETIGISRINEPVGVYITFNTPTPVNDIRVLDTSGQEIPSQVHNITLDGNGKCTSANIAFLANCPALSSLQYTILYNNQTPCPSPTYDGLRLIEEEAGNTYSVGVTQADVEKNYFRIFWNQFMDLYSNGIKVTWPGGQAGWEFSQINLGTLWTDVWGKTWFGAGKKLSVLNSGPIFVDFNYTEAYASDLWGAVFDFNVTTNKIIRVYYQPDLNPLVHCRTTFNIVTNLASYTIKSPYYLDFKLANSTSKAIYKSFTWKDKAGTISAIPADTMFPTTFDVWSPASPLGWWSYNGSRPDSADKPAANMGLIPTYSGGTIAGADYTLKVDQLLENDDHRCSQWFKGSFNGVAGDKIWTRGYIVTYRPVNQNVASLISNEATKLRNPLTCTAGNGSPSSGVPSSIKYLFVVEMSHLDIGFTHTPDVVEQFYKMNIDHVIANCKADPDYKWTIEEIWQLEQWLKRSTPSEIDELIDLVKQGRISLTAGYASMHSGVLGHEEINRFLYPAKQIATAWNISIETIIQDDVPGYSWALPQVLNKSNVRYMVTGINTWLGMGGTSIPMSSIPFYWQGPDGSKVLTWISFDAYVEGFTTYGLTDITNAYDKLSTKLPQLESQGYPYDAVLVMRGGDNWDTSLDMTNLARQWNDTYDNPKMVLAHPEGFFRYMESKYAGQFPTYSGDWTSWWDILGMTQPQSITKNRWAHDNILSAEKLSTINHLLGLQAYPADDIELAYKKMMEFDEHMTGGAPWPGYMTPEETRRQNEILCGYATAAYNTTADILQTGLETLAGDVRSEKPSIIVFNPLSWNRTDVLRVKLSDGLFSRTFNLVDSETGLSVIYQKLEETKEIMFVAENVLSIGYKKFEINFSEPSTSPSSVYVSENIIGNQFYEVTLDNVNGHIMSIYDKEADRELVNQASEFEFNKAIKATNLEVWSGQYSVVPTGTSEITIGINGSVAKSLVVNRQNSPHMETEVILYNDIKRIDLVNVMNRTQMAYVSYSTNFVWYAYPFPFNLTSFDVKLEIANTFMTPEVDNLPGAGIPYFPTQHGLEIFEANYGVTWASKETFCHEFEGLNLYATTFSPSEATLVSRWIKKEDEGKFKDGSIGPIDQEPGASPILVQTYSFKTHPGPFNPVNTTNFIWSYSNPLLAKEVSSNPNGSLFYPSMSFFSVNSSSVMILNVKKADFGCDYIFRLLEIEGSQTAVRLGSSYFHIDQAILTNNVEENLKKLSTEERYAVASIGPFETLTIRLKLATRRARFSVATLYEVHLEVNMHLLNDASLKVFFYNYSGVYEANVTVWSGSTPTHVVLSANIPHPLNKGIENATLVLVDSGGNVISSATSFVMCRPQLFYRFIVMDGEWPYASPEQRSTMMEEYADIGIQWSYAGA